MCENAKDHRFSTREDTEEDVDATGRENKIQLMQIKCVNRRRSSE